MAKRQPRTLICSGCIEEFPEKELYIVERFVNKTTPDPKNKYYTPYCKKCIKNTGDYYQIHSHPKKS